MDAARVTRVRALRPHWLRLWFADGSVHEVDLGPTLARGGVFAEIYADPDLFTQVRVQERFGTIEWPGPVDVDPDVLRGTHTAEGGTPLERRILRDTGAAPA